VRRPLWIACAALALGPLVPVVFGDTTSLQSVLFNVNGTQYTSYAVPGITTAAWDQTTGIGTLTIVFDPGAPGSYFFDVFLDHELSTPFFNEYGIVNGAPAAGQSYEIGDSFASNIYSDVQTGGDLSNTNTLGGTASNFSLSCSGADCNGDAALAMGFSFVLGVDEEELITLTTSHRSIRSTRPTIPRASFTSPEAPSASQAATRRRRFRSREA